MDGSNEISHQLDDFHLLLLCPCTLLAKFHLANTAERVAHVVALFRQLLELAAQRSRSVIKVELL